MEIKGKIILDIPMQSGVSQAGREWKKKEWVLETVDTQFPRKVKFTCFGDRADSVHVELGKTYIIGIDIESREYNGRWYTDVNAFSAREDGTMQPTDMTAGGTTFATEPTFPTGAPEFQAPAAGAPSTDDLPF